MRTKSKTLNLSDYIKLRLGQSTQQQAVNFLKLPFGATSFAKFWWYWNPLYGYYLYYYCYKPLVRHLPRSIVIITTFIFSGAVHDLPFVILSAFTTKRLPSFTITLMFLFLGINVVVTEKWNVTFKEIPVIFRWFIHLLNIFCCWRLALHVTTEI